MDGITFGFFTGDEVGREYDIEDHLTDTMSYLDYMRDKANPISQDDNNHGPLSNTTTDVGSSVDPDPVPLDEEAVADFMNTPVQSYDEAVPNPPKSNDLTLDNLLSEFFRTFPAPGVPEKGKGLVTGEVEAPLVSATEDLAHVLKPKGGAAAKDLLGGNTTGLLGIAAGTALSGAFQMTGNIVSTSMKDATDEEMQGQRNTEQTLLQQNQIANQQFMQAQAFSDDSQLSAQSFEQSSQLMNLSLADQESYYSFVMEGETAALAQAGLPSYLAYFPGGMKYQPHMKQVTPAGTTYTARVPGTANSVAYNGSATQTALGYGNVSAPPPVS